MQLEASRVFQCSLLDAPWTTGLLQAPESIFRRINGSNTILNSILSSSDNEIFSLSLRVGIFGSRLGRLRIKSTICYKQKIMDHESDTLDPRHPYPYFGHQYLFQAKVCIFDSDENDSPELSLHWFLQ